MSFDLTSPSQSSSSLSFLREELEDPLTHSLFCCLPRSVRKKYNLEVSPSSSSIPAAGSVHVSVPGRIKVESTVSVSLSDSGGLHLHRERERERRLSFVLRPRVCLREERERKKERIEEFIVIKCSKPKAQHRACVCFRVASLFKFKKGQLRGQTLSKPANNEEV